MSQEQPITTDTTTGSNNGESHQAKYISATQVKVEKGGNESQIAKEASNQGKFPKAFPNRWQAGTMLFTGATAIATVGMYFSSSSANIIAKSAAVSAAQSAAAAQQAAAAAKLQVRAQVAVHKGQVTWQSGRADVQLTILNSGQTIAPAAKISIDVLCCEKYPLELGMFPMSQPLTGDYEISEDTEYPLPSGASFTWKRSIAISPEDMREIKSRTKAVYIVGVVTYTDEFNELHTQRFGLMQGGRFAWDAESMGAIPLAQ